MQLLPGTGHASGPVGPRSADDDPPAPDSGGGGRPRTAFAQAVLRVVAGTGPGELLTYGEVAQEAGRPGAARAVGAVLRRHGAAVPWWRVVTARGRLVPGNEREQVRRLAAEGVIAQSGHVSVERSSVSRSGGDGG